MPTLAERFWAKVDVAGEDECWIWKGARSGRQYGFIRDQGKMRPATRVVWEFTNDAPFPDGVEACHTCDNPPCVNPRHIFTATHSENMKDADRKGRIVNGNTQKTHCRYGHPLVGENLFSDSRGQRRCRTTTGSRSDDQRGG